MNIDEIKQEKLQELMKKQEEAAQEELLLQKQIKVLEDSVKSHMTQDAFSRYTNLKLAHKEYALKILVLLNQALESGKFQKINDNEFKELLKRFQEKKPSFNIKRK